MTPLFAALSLALAPQAPLGDLSPGPASSLVPASDARASVGDTTVFPTVDETTLAQTVWSSDGTAVGTVAIPGIPGVVEQLVPFGDRVLLHRIGAFAEASELESYEPATGLVTSLGSATATLPEGIDPGGVLGELFVYANFEMTHGDEPWVTDGTTAGSRRLADLVPGSGNSSPRGFHRIGSEIYFFAQDATQQLAIWRTDGTTTTRAGSGPTGERRRSVVSGGTLFWTQVSIQPIFLFPISIEVYAFDSATGATTELISAPIVTAGADVSDLAPLGDGRVAFEFDPNGFDATNDDREPFVSDGTVAGTGRILDLNPGGGSSAPAFYPHRLGDRALFDGFDGTRSGTFATDGTAAGTTFVFDEPPVGSIDADRALVRRTDPVTARVDLFASDGDSTELLATDIGSLPARARSYVHGGKLYFLRTDATNGSEPWVAPIAPSAVEVGAGCATGSRIPTLRVGAPRLGTTFDFRGGDAPAGAVAGIFVSLVPDTPTRLGGPCISELDASSLGVLRWFVPAASTWTWSWTLPSVPALQGLTLATQAWFASSQLGVETTNGVHLSLGALPGPLRGLPDFSPLPRSLPRPASLHRS